MSYGLKYYYEGNKGKMVENGDPNYGLCCRHGGILFYKVEDTERVLCQLEETIEKFRNYIENKLGEEGIDFCCSELCGGA